MTISRRVISGTALFFLLMGVQMLSAQGTPGFDAGRWRYEGAYDYGEARPVEAAADR